MEERRRLVLEGRHPVVIDHGVTEDQAAEDDQRIEGAALPRIHRRLRVISTKPRCIGGGLGRTPKNGSVHARATICVVSSDSRRETTFPSFLLPIRSVGAAISPERPSDPSTSTNR